MGDVALSGILLWHGVLLSEVSQVTTVEVGVAKCSYSGRWCRQA
jgi:hypothetical protein